MDNPNTKLRAAVAWFLLGAAVGLLPGLIRADEMRREAEAVTASTAAEVQGLRTSMIARDAAAADACQRRVDSWVRNLSTDTTRTILVDENHPYGEPEWTMFGVSLRLPPPAARVVAGPIWVIPQNVTPQVVDGILAGQYTHVYADGKTDGWQRPQRAQ